MSILTFGYGCYIDSLNLKPNREKELERLFSEELRSEFDEAWEDNKDGFASKDEFLECFTEEYTNDRGGMGLEALMADVINYRSFGGRHVVSGSDMVIYALPLLPKTEEERNAMPLLPDVKEAISEIVRAVAKDPDKIELGYSYFEEL